MIPNINFNDPYKRSDFLPFLEWFLPDDFLITEEKLNNLNFATKYTEDVTKLGTCQSLELDVYEITHTSTHDARVGIAQDAFRLMLYKSYNNRALIIFKTANSSKYRFSLLQIEAEVSDNTSRITRSFSNPRRYSFQLGEDAHVKTPTQFLLENGKLVKKDGSYFNDLENRFSVEVLTKQFYKELSDWYFWALRYVEFPSKPTYEQSIEANKPLEEMIKEHNATNTIRLLTRLLFVWFIKQKRLIPDELFDVDELENNILTELNPVKEDILFSEMGKDSVYYKAILQNLFFASLNCPIKLQSGDEDKRQRGFRRKNNYGDDFGNDWLFRYEKYFKNPDAFVELINSKVPFLNGGLFECLDDKTNKKYIDGFSDNLQKPDRLIVPDYLFFGKDENVDLSEDYGDNSLQYKQISVKGLINILKTYNFTVEENTPAEVVVALDPELLGKVFENLLASFNPETKTTARKQTGSFYTPREIVNYMVDESLIAYFKGKTNITEENIRALFMYSDEEHKLSTSQIEELIKALYECKILDPACGSGAFPMGVLQKLVHLLQKVDPQNYFWKKIQNENATKEIQKALDIEDKKDRENRLIEINNAFDITKNRPDYARKLYLVENCIYGVDIQPIAIQISKLRFFISLVVDQKNNYKDENFGIIPLPNLETKFVTANTLIGINRSSRQLTISYTDEIRKLQEELRVCRHKIFSAKSKKTKHKYRLIDKEKRLAIAEELKNNGWNNEDADKLANWDPYDQNTSSPFFDPEWMFGLERKNVNSNTGEVGGYFDVVIGNPPYISAPDQVKDEVLNNQRKNIVKSKKYKTLFQKWDLYIPFVERGMQLLCDNGIFSMIIPYPVTNQFYAKKLRQFILNECDMFEIVDLNGTKIFENATVSNCIPFIRKSHSLKETQISRIDNQKNISVAFTQNHDDLVQDKDSGVWNLTQEVRVGNRHPELNILGDYCYISKGMVLNADEKKAKGEFKKDDLISLTKDEIHNREYIEAKDIERYNIKRVRYLEYGTKRCPGDLSRPTFPELYNRNKIVMNCLGRLNSYLDDSLFVLHNHSIYSAVRWCDLKGVNNKSISASVKRYSRMKRKDMETLSESIDLRYLLGILNSSYAKILLDDKRAGDYHIYPEHIRNIPIAEASTDQQKPIINLVVKVIDSKSTNPNDDTSELEHKIDILVYKLYNLTYEEVKVIDPEFDLTEIEYTYE